VHNGEEKEDTEMEMSKTLRQHLAVIQHNIDGRAQDPKIRYKTYQLLLRENYGMLPAQRQLEAAADLDYPPALIDLATLFLNGQYLEKTENGFQPVRDCEKAVQFLKRAADTGDTQACLLLAACCCKGIGCTKSDIEAEKYIGRISKESLREFFGGLDEEIDLRSNMLSRVVYLLGIWPIHMLYAETKREGVSRNK